MKKITLTIGLMCYTMFALAQDQISDSLQLQEIVITGTRFKIPVEKSGKTIYRLSAVDLEKNIGKTIADMLNNIPGMQIDGNFGTPGSNMSYYLRGGRNRNTLIITDGVPLNDPSAITAFYDLRYLSVEQVESIEILNGGLSTLYGTGAAAGVINIKLKEASKKALSGTVNVNGGSYNTWNEHIQLSGSTKKFSYLIAGNNSTSTGFSSAEELDATSNFDKDGFSKQNGLIKLGYNMSDKWEVALISEYDRFVSNYDDGAFLDADNQLESHQFRIGITPTFKHAKGKIILKTLYNANENEFRSNFPQRYNGRNLQVDLSENYVFDKNFKIIAGMNSQSMSYEELDVSTFEENSFNMLDPYASMAFDTEFGLNIHAGVRLNIHDFYDSKFVYNINPSYLINFGNWKIKLRTALSTSYITPSSYQIYSIYGNKELKPEESLNYEGGLDIYFRADLTFNAVYFRREESEQIDFVSLYDDLGNWTGGVYNNAQEHRTINGFEFNLKWKLLKLIALNAYYTQSASDNDQTYYRIPNDKWSVSIDISLIKKINLSVRYLHTGKRKDFDYLTFSEIDMKKFDVFNINVSYELWNSKLKLYGVINNITDTKNIGVYGFKSRGRNATVGLKFSF